MLLCRAVIWKLQETWSSSMSSFAFVVAVAIAWTWVIVTIAWTWVIVAVVVAVVADKAWGLVTSFKLERPLLHAWSPVDVIVIGTQICKIVNAELSFGTGRCFAGLSFVSCKKLEVMIAGPLLRTGSCLKCGGASFGSGIVLLGVFGLL